jgi:thymidylate synthase (FAD)
MNRESIHVPPDGFVRLVDTMGTDADVCQAARISTGKQIQTGLDDERLIRYMMRHGHTSPFEMCEIKLHVRLPMDVQRQWIRHRTASVNEYSTRYSPAISRFAKAQQWRSQGTQSNQQASGEGVDPIVGLRASVREMELHVRLHEEYERRLADGIAREQARKDLPLCTYTEMFWKIDLHNLLGFLRQRLAPEAQQEIREYAQVIAGIVAEWCPITWRAFEDYQLYSVRLSRQAVELLRCFLQHCPITKGWRLSKGEKKELKELLYSLGVSPDFLKYQGALILQSVMSDDTEGKPDAR